MNRLKNLFLNITNSPQYLNYIEFLIRQTAKSAVDNGPQYTDDVESTFFPDEELAALLVEFRVLPPMPEIIKGVYYDSFKNNFFCDGYSSNASKLLNKYIKQQQVGGKLARVKKVSKKRSTKRRSKKRSTKRKSKKRSTKKAF